VKKAKLKVRVRKPKEEPAPLPAHPTYEYTYIEINATVDKADIISQCNTLGDEGWQFEQANQAGGMYQIWFVREK
jgi:hypothetical protein